MRESIIKFLNKQSKELTYSGGVLLSFIFHVLCLLIALLALQRTKEEAQATQIFTVTLEGGQSLGGLTQVPKPGAEKEKPKPGAIQETKANIKTALEETEVDKEKNNSQEEEDKKEALAIEDAKKAIVEKKIEQEKKLAEIQKLEEAKKQQKKQQEELEKKKEEEKKQLEEAKKKKTEEDEKKAELAKKDMERKLRDRRLAEIAQKVRGTTYNGESANAGGEGMGAARLGGQGMGGGILASAEFVAYQNALQEHVKSGWRWLSGRERLICIVVVDILPDGKIKNVTVGKSSGNSTFDDSVVRAIRKSDPVPAAPADLYNSFKSVSFKFDSNERI